MTRPAQNAVVIGASAGAVQALSRILPALPADPSLAVIVVVHVPRGRSNSLVALFQPKCRIRVCEAEDKAPIENGVVYFAPPDYHLLIETDRRLALSMDPPVLHSRPSIDVLFESAADAYGSDLVGVVLTGANHDGAAGLRAIADAGGQALVQDPSQAYAAAMPAAALAACAAARRMSLDALATHLAGLGLHE